MTATSFTGARGVRLAADVTGPADGPAVVLWHGGGQTRHSWGDTVTALAERGFLTVNVDMRGHGDSGWDPAGDYAMDVVAEDVRAVARSLDRPVALVGASMGGLAALTAVGENPGFRCTALVLVDITPRVDDEGRQQVVDFMRGGLDGFASLDEAAAAVSRYLPHRSANGDVSGLVKNLRRDGDGRYRWHWDPALLDPARLDRTKGDPHRSERAAAAVTAPMLLVRGGSSELVREQDARAFLDVAPAAEYVEVTKAAHMVAGDRNGEFTSAVTAFLTRTLVSKE